jgi:AraC-like DNA-binding protein
VQEFTVGSAEVRALIGSLAALGLDPDALLRAVDLAPSLLHDPEARAPEAILVGVWMTAEASWTGGQLGLRAGSNAPIGAFEVLDYLAGASDTVGAGFRRLVEFSAIADTGLTYALDESGDPIVISMQHPYAFEFLPRSFVEYLWTTVVGRFRAHLDGRVRPVLRLKHGPDGPLATYREVLGDVVFHAERDELLVSRHDWELPNPRRDTALSRVLERHARDLLAKLPKRDDPVERIETAMLEGLRAGTASIEDTAARLHVSTRTLQRQLTDAGLTYKSVLDAMRAELAHVLLVSTERSLLEITFLLGYSDASAFNRAFRRWTGTTPLEYRSSGGVTRNLGSSPGAGAAPGSGSRPHLPEASGPPLEPPRGGKAPRRTGR